MTDMQVVSVQQQCIPWAMQCPNSSSRCKPASQPASQSVSKCGLLGSPAFQCRKDLPTARRAPAECCWAQHERPQGVTTKSWWSSAALEQRHLAGLQAKVGMALEQGCQLVVGGRRGHDVPTGLKEGVGRGGGLDLAHFARPFTSRTA